MSLKRSCINLVESCMRETADGYRGMELTVILIELECLIEFTARLNGKKKEI